jgi:hypothetical protein
MLRTPVKSFYCHTCRSSSLIDVSDLRCPKCQSDFLEESRLPAEPVDDYPRLPESSYSSDSDSVMSDAPENAPPDRPVHSLLSLFLMQHRRAPFERPFLNLDQNDEENGEIFHLGLFGRLLNGSRERRRHLPTSEETIQGIEKVCVEREWEVECKICGERFEEGEEAKRILCEHLFHENCLVPWLRIKNSCPVCRKTVD